MSQRTPHATLNTYHLGLWYSVYRFIITTGLLLIYLLTYQQLASEYQSPRLYLYALSAYALISSLQFFVFRGLKTHIQIQLVTLFIVDVSALSLLTLALDGPNLHISLLFVICIFAASLLLSAQKALLITLVAVISVIYQLFIGTLFDISSLKNIGNSALLAFLFFVVYGSGQIAIRRFQILENLNFSQSLQINQLQNINRYILEQIKTGYLVLDQNCHVVLTNPEACTLLGIDPLYQIDTYPLYKVQPDLFEVMKFEDLPDGDTFQFESQQSRFHIHVRVQKLNVPHQTLTLLVLQDAQKLNQHVQQLKLAALGQLSASIAHEIRNPLAAIVQANDLYQDCDPEQQQLLHKMIAKQAMRIDRIVQDTLNMVKNKETRPLLIQLNSFLQQMIEDDLPDIQNKIQLSIEEELQIYFDEGQLTQILINLIRNAIRHNDPNASHIELNIHAKEQKVMIDVRDFGNGVAKQDQASLFQPFFSTEITGTGLGLYLAHSFCEANQAQLSYIEQNDQGACFRIVCFRAVG
jgi:two-component system sensor histidine kinase PilS (NtrC family)